MTQSKKHPKPLIQSVVLETDDAVSLEKMLTCIIGLTFPNPKKTYFTHLQPHDFFDGSYPQQTTDEISKESKSPQYMHICNATNIHVANSTKFINNRDLVKLIVDTAIGVNQFAFSHSYQSKPVPGKPHYTLGWRIEKPAKIQRVDVSMCYIYSAKPGGQEK